MDQIIKSNFIAKLNFHMELKRVASSPIINNNNPPYYFPNNYSKGKVKRIKPNKFTFLNSNLMISNIITPKNNTQTDEPNPSQNAYVNFVLIKAFCEEEGKKFSEEK